ncbi:MAG: ATP-dependent helicase, partial [Brevefilum sp.]
QNIKLRPGQERILSYQNGKMGVSAVPGSGKTWTLSYFAAKLIRAGAVNPNQEILVVTLVNAAVENFATRISSHLRAENLLPGYGYRVRTLHGLANDIVRERPDLAGLSNDYQIIDETEADRIKRAVVQDWLGSNIDFFEPYLEYEDYQKEKIYDNKYNLPRMVESIATAFIRLAKDRQLTPETLRQRLLNTQIKLPLVEMGTQIYRSYQEALVYRGSVDFDDLIRLALHCLESDPALVDLLRERWPYILEDEAQDSSLLQQQILSILTGDSGNWVRVGDPNQAIYETFTTASPQYFLDFLNKPNVMERTLPESGRSSQSIINLANRLIEWTQTEHPNLEARSALNPPFIQPTPPDDPQPNPMDCPECIQFVERGLSPDEEINYVVTEVEKFLAENPDKTIAILTPRNIRAFKFADELKRREIPYIDSLLQSTSATRLSTGAIANILQYLSNPKSSRKLASAYKVWRRSAREDNERWPFHKEVAKVIRSCDNVEDYLWPSPTQDWLEEALDQVSHQTARQELTDFREVVKRWHNTILLPIDQLVLTVSQDLFLDPVELALAYKLSSLLRQFSDDHPDWRLPEFTEELANIARNERRYLGFSREDEAFNPNLYPGRVLVATMHKAKGLEWDCVFLTSLNNYNFPSGHDYDQFQSEKWFVRGHLNLEAETIAQLKILLEDHPFGWHEPGKASLEARQEFIRERLRLFYVGITRARRWLTATWNTGRTSQKNVAALPFLELINDLERRHATS